MDSTTLEILDRIHAMYGRSWDQLLAVVGVLAVLLGVVIPLWIQWAQRRLFSLERSQLEAAIQEEGAAVGRRLSKDLDARADAIRTALEERHTKLAADLKDATRVSEAHIWFLQGQLLLTHGEVLHALESFLYSARKYADAREYAHTRAAFQNINLCLKSLELHPVLQQTRFAAPGEQDRDRIDDQLTEDFKKLVGKLESLDEDTLYTVDIRGLKSAFDRALRARDKQRESAGSGTDAG